MDKLSMSLDDIIKRNRGNKGPRTQNRNGPNRKINQGRGQNRPPKNKFGLLNQSRRIGKNNRMKRNNSSFVQRNRPNPNKLAKLKSRLSLNKPVGLKGFKRTRPNLMPKRQSNFVPKKRLHQPQRVNNNKANSAMKAAKKNLDKAKRLLANRISKVKQIAANLNKKQRGPQRPNPKIKRLNNNRTKLAGVGAFNRPKNLRSQVSRGRNVNRTSNRKVFY
ncbi:hypothetical protein BpHYR1_024746 [Brachionus plicatilis]|uniref:Uncharacterized protein n=1 Tax=Brachionus plicatilis TaxID=10195 RepID=A0A3M7QUH0_BRAPC|nr:hypothetical protein BpHYR1_024746 [Brachionus plicatilis]